jgi:hypothetical protein
VAFYIYFFAEKQLAGTTKCRQDQPGNRTRSVLLKFKLVFHLGCLGVWAVGCQTRKCPFFGQVCDLDTSDFRISFVFEFPLCSNFLC